jgi:SAM-dependent methyltransferase
MKQELKKLMPQGCWEYYWLRRQLKKCPAFSRSILEATAKAFLLAADEVSLRQLESQSAAGVAQYPTSSFKYTRVNYCLQANLIRAARLGLHSSSKRSILDLGAGPGWFVAVACFYGHHATGLDLPYESMPAQDRIIYPPLNACLGVSERIMRGVVPTLRPLEVEGTFDIITAFSVCFNNHKTDQTWGPREWAYFLEDLKSRLAPGGMARIELNPDAERFPEYAYYDAPTATLLQKYGSLERSEFQMNA